MNQTIHNTLQQTIALLTSSDSARLDAELLLAHVLQQSREYLHTWPEQQLSPAQTEEFNTLIYKRRDGWPIAYLVGHQAFWTLDLLVTPATLIPRPETELLIETALSLFPDEQPRTVIDLGTGSGAIALAIAKERPHWHVHATDASIDALAVARENARRHQIHNVTFRQGSWYAALPAELRADLIVSNPPYICVNDPHLSQGDVRFEPVSALIAGTDGLDSIRDILIKAPQHLDAAGWVLLEHGYDQAETVHTLLVSHHFHQISQHTDLAGHTRVTQGQV